MPGGCVEPTWVVPERVTVCRSRGHAVPWDALLARCLLSAVSAACVGPGCMELAVRWDQEGIELGKRNQLLRKDSENQVLTENFKDGS